MVTFTYLPTYLPTILLSLISSLAVTFWKLQPYILGLRMNTLNSKTPSPSSPRVENPDSFKFYSFTSYIGLLQLLWLPSLTYLPTPYLPTYRPTYILTYLPTYLLTNLPNYLSTYLLTNIPTYLPIYLLSYLLTYLPTNLLT